MAESRVIVFAGFIPKPGQESELEALLRGVTGQTRREPGCEVYDLYVASEAPTSFHLFESYTNGAALEVHRTSEYYKAYRQPFWPVYVPRTFLTSSYSGNLGHAYPVALGAKVARPDRPVVCVSGDGGFLYNA